MTSKHNQFRIFNLIESLEDSGWRQFYLNVLLLNVIISNKFPRIPIEIERRVHNHIFYLGARNKWINSINIGNFVVIRWNDCQNCVSCFRKYMNLNILVVIINVFVWCTTQFMSTPKIWEWFLFIDSPIDFPHLTYGAFSFMKGTFSFMKRPRMVG